jgi:hypothetical protein
MRFSLPRCMSPEVALCGHAEWAWRCPLPGVERKSDFGAVRSANDPKRTFGSISCTLFVTRWRVTK